MVLIPRAEPLAEPLAYKNLSEVEADETFVGGQYKNKHWNKKSRHAKGTIGKTPDIGAVSRKGNIVAKLIEQTDRRTPDGFVREASSRKVSYSNRDSPEISRAGIAGCRGRHTGSSLCAVTSPVNFQWTEAVSIGCR